MGKENVIMFVGLSSKPEKNLFEVKPLCSSTNTGKIVDQISEKLVGFKAYKTNLVKFAPIDGRGKLRYPTKPEMENSFHFLYKEIKSVRPSVVVLFGSMVTDFVLLKLQNLKKIETNEKFSKLFTDGSTLFIATHHPSYIHVYKRKMIHDYTSEVAKIACWSH